MKTSLAPSPYNMYTRTSVTPIISHTEIKPYKITIHDIPDEQKPRERAIREGLTVLSLAELWALILGSGTKKEDVMSMSQRIIKEYGERSITQVTQPQKIADELDIPLGKAMQIGATLEIGRRLFERNPSGAKIIRTAHDVFEYTQNMAHLTKEHLRGIYLNSHYKVIHDEVISIGTLDSNLVHPREIFRPALEYAAAAIILVHNHPSGNTDPSHEDIIVTEQLLEAGKLLGIELIDHVIISTQGFQSIMEFIKK